MTVQACGRRLLLRGRRPGPLRRGDAGKLPWTRCGADGPVKRLARQHTDVWDL